MTELLQSDGEVIKDEIRIIVEVHTFYSKLYSTDPGFKDKQSPMLQEILSHVTKVLT
jgi:hypothetical protein